MSTLYQGDSSQLLCDFEDLSVDCTITSPPYDSIRDYNGYVSQWNFEKFKTIANQLYRITKQGGVVVWIVSDQTVKGSETGTSFKQALYFKDIGFNIHDTMIWSKGSFSSVGTGKVRYYDTFEYMFIFSKDKVKTFNAIKDRKNIHAGKKCHGTLRLPNGKLRPSYTIGKIHQEYGQRFNVWEMPPVHNNHTKKESHPAAFPLKLAKDHIRSWTNEGDIILDPFMGSGTTGVACAELGRKFMGIEICPAYYQFAKKRIEQAEIDFLSQISFKELEE